MALRLGLFKFNLRHMVRLGFRVVGRNGLCVAGDEKMQNPLDPRLQQLLDQIKTELLKQIKPLSECHPTVEQVRDVAKVFEKLDTRISIGSVDIKNDVATVALNIPMDVVEFEEEEMWF